MALLAASAGDGTGAGKWLVSMPAFSARDGERPVVLFVEDQPMVRFTTTMHLVDAGYAVVAVATGEEALTLLHGNMRVDVLLTDLRLPGMIDGWDIAERARQLRPDLPVIYASAYSYVTPRQVDGSVMLDKPYPPEALLDALDTLLD